jgi:hypothetical protein
MRGSKIRKRQGWKPEGPRPSRSVNECAPKGSWFTTARSAPAEAHTSSLNATKLWLAPKHVRGLNAQDRC